jgi:ABC-type transport system substrate-binding protein
MLQEDLAACGVQLEVEVRESQELFASWPQGEVFGRRFEMVDWAWPVFISPPCEMFLSSEIPADGNSLGINASGFRNLDYDHACRRLLLGTSATDGYLQAVQSTQELLASNLPAVPLFLHPRIVVHAEGLCGIEVDPSAISVFWNVESYYFGDTCVE